MSLKSIRAGAKVKTEALPIDEGLSDLVLAAGTETASITGVMHCRHPFSFKEKLHSTTHGHRVSKSCLCSSYSCYTHPFNGLNLSSCMVCKARESFDAVVTDCKWNELVIASNNLVLINFWAPWCEPIEPVVNELAKEYEGRIECYKMNTDDYPNIQKQLRLRSILTVLLFKDGEMKESFIGAVSKSALKVTIEMYLDG